MLAITIVIAHDSIHHHHSPQIVKEIAIPHSHHEDDHHDDGDHFPIHQHILADADFYPVRNVFFGGKFLKHIHMESSMVDSVSDKIFKFHLSGFIWIYKDPPFLEGYSPTPNLTRGSPSFS